LFVGLSIVVLPEAKAPVMNSRGLFSTLRPSPVISRLAPDPAFETIISAGAGRPMSLAEVREAAGKKSRAKNQQAMDRKPMDRKQ
jgi:hypothetical protein